jgi:hypothetical protein
MSLPIVVGEKAFISGILRKVKFDNFGQMVR